MSRDCVYVVWVGGWVDGCLSVSDPRFVQFALGDSYAVHINVLSISWKCSSKGTTCKLNEYDSLKQYRLYSRLGDTGASSYMCWLLQRYFMQNYHRWRNRRQQFYTNPPKKPLTTNTKHHCARISQYYGHSSCFIPVKLL